jgi:hypothetical protein
MIYLKGVRVCICGFAEVFSPQTQKDWVRKSQIRKVSHLWKVSKFSKLFKSEDLRFLFADRPALLPLAFHPLCLTSCNFPFPKSIFSALFLLS